MGESVGPQLRKVTPSAHVSLGQLQSELAKISGIRSVSVIGDDSPVEIHVVAESNRPPKQVVRDVQSLAAAHFGLTLDHRIVSVVQMDEGHEEETASEGRRRPVLDRVVFANKGNEGWVKVALQWPDGSTTEGAAAAGASRETRARGAAAAVQQALEPALAPDATIEVDHVMIQQVGMTDSVIAKVIVTEAGRPTTLLGSAIIHDDVVTAAVHAMLHAVNRKLH